MAKSKTKKILLILLVLILAGVAVVGWYAYSIAFKPNIAMEKEKDYIYISTGSTFNDLQQGLVKRGIMKDGQSFRYVARYMKYDRNVIPGKYEIRDGMSNMQLIRELRSGKQVPIDISFDRIQFKDQVASALGNALECDSAEVMRLLEDETYLTSKGFTRENVMAMFVSNTYRFQWNTTAKKALNRLFTEYQNVWNERRKDQAEFVGLTEPEVMTLASIVQSETAKKDEAPRVAGAYLNRLRIGMKLEADPTSKYAQTALTRDTVIQRVKGNMLRIESPYNTYVVKGLPPGPIVVPALWAIDAVLNPEKSNYIYFCAKEDFSGYHNFTDNLDVHNANARKYRAALKARGIR